MSKKNKKSKNNSGYIFTGSSAANSARNKKHGGKKINKSQASAGSTVDAPAKKKHLNVIGTKEKTTPVDRTLGHAIHADHRFVHRWGRKVEGAQKREDFVNNLPKNTGSIRSAIGSVFAGASASISGRMAEYKAHVEMRDKAFYNARKAAREVWDKDYKPTKAERAVQF